MTVDQLVQHFGSRAEAARALGLTWGALRHWERNGAVPYLRQLHVERLTRGKIKADKLPKAAA